MIIVITTDENGSSRKIIKPMTLHDALHVALWFELSGDDRTANIYRLEDGQWRKIG